MSLPKRVVLISYPRSGSHLVRYCIEYLTKLPTFGNEGPLIISKKSKPWILYRRHFWDILSKGEKQVKTYHPRMIFLFRNYHECIISQMKRSKQGQNTIRAIKQSKNVSMHRILASWKDNRKKDVQTKFTPSSLIDNIKKFHAFKGKKLVIYYEDLMSDLQPELEKLLEFMSVEPQENIANFVANQAEHRAKSFGKYNSIQGSLSQGRASNFHSSILTKKQKQDMDLYFSRCLGPLYEKYLGRYISVRNGSVISQQSR